MSQRKTRRRTQERFAVCVDDRGGPDWLKRHHVYRVLPDPYVERDGLVRIGDDFGEEDEVFVAHQFLFGERAARSNRKGTRRIIAARLEAEARLQKRGLVHRLGERYAVTLLRLCEAAPLWHEDVSFALTFWEEWVEAARRGWRKCGDMTAEDWVRFARKLARDLRRGRLTCDLDLLARRYPEKPRPRPQWFRGVYGPR